MDQKFILKAQNELKETDDLKAEKLQEFKTWIANHDYFKNVRQGESLLFSSHSHDDFITLRSTSRR